MTYHDIGNSIFTVKTQTASDGFVGMAWQDAEWVKMLTSLDKDATAKAVDPFISHLATLHREFSKGGYISDLAQTLKETRNAPNVSYARIYGLEEKVAEKLLHTVPAFSILPKGANDYCKNFVINLYGRMLANDANSVKRFVPKDVVLQACINEFERILVSIFVDYERVQQSWFSKMDALARGLAEKASENDQRDQLLQIGKRIMAWSHRASPHPA